MERPVFDLIAVLVDRSDVNGHQLVTSKFCDEVALLCRVALNLPCALVAVEANSAIWLDMDVHVESLELLVLLVSVVHNHFLSIIAFPGLPILLGVATIIAY